jgi:hypothetical protein
LKATLTPFFHALPISGDVAPRKAAKIKDFSKTRRHDEDHGAAKNDVQTKTCATAGAIAFILPSLITDADVRTHPI